MFDKIAHKNDLTMPQLRWAEVYDGAIGLSQPIDGQQWLLCHHGSSQAPNGSALQ